MSALDHQHHSGAEWVVKALKTEISPFGARVADLLGYAFAGIYHIDHKALAKVDWKSDRYIKLLYYGKSGLSTYDSTDLTRLVFLAHQFAVRFSIEPCNFQHVYFVFSPRERGQDLFTGHPDLTEASQSFLEHFRNMRYEKDNYLNKAWEKIALESKA